MADKEDLEPLRDARHRTGEIVLHLMHLRKNLGDRRPYRAIFSDLDVIVGALQDQVERDLGLPVR